MYWLRRKAVGLFSVTVSIELLISWLLPCAYYRKQCVQTNSVFDFLQEIVSKIPDIGSETACEERTSGRRRYVTFLVELLQKNSNCSVSCSLSCCIRSWKWIMPWCQNVCILLSHDVFATVEESTSDVLWDNVYRKQSDGDDSDEEEVVKRPKLVF
jgi:hypothetical protein